MFDPSVLNFPTFNTVPDLLDAVVADCHTILENPNYTPLAQEWHTPISHGKTSSCAVCLAGGFLVRQLKPPKNKDLVPSDFPKRVAHILYAVNGIRQGQLVFNLEVLLKALPEDATTTLNTQTPKTIPQTLQKKLKEAAQLFGKPLLQTGEFNDPESFRLHLGIIANLSSWLRKNIPDPGFAKPLN